MAIEGEVKSSIEEREALLESKEYRRGRNRRKQAMEVMNEDSVAALDQIFTDKLTAIRASEKRLANISDPYAHKALEHLIQEEYNQLLHLADLIEIVEKNPESSSFTRTRRQMSHRFKNKNNQSFAYGIGVALLGALLYPTIKDSLRPVALKAMQGVKDLSEQAQSLVGSVREDMEDFVAEAEFEKLKQSIDTAVADESDVTLNDSIT